MGHLHGSRSARDRAHSGQRSRRRRTGRVRDDRTVPGVLRLLPPGDPHRDAGLAGRCRAARKTRARPRTGDGKRAVRFGSAAAGSAGRQRRAFDTVPLVPETPSAPGAADRQWGARRGWILRSPLAWCFVLVAVEAVVILVGLGVGNAPLTGGDGPDYTRLAHNLLSHGIFSSSSSPPLLENIGRAPGYPVVLAIFDFVAMHLGIGQVLMVRICQFAMVAVTAWLVYAIAREVADGLTARVAGLLTASY